MIIEFSKDGLLDRLGIKSRDVHIEYSNEYEKLIISDE